MMEKDFNLKTSGRLFQVLPLRPTSSPGAPDYMVVRVVLWDRWGRWVG